jgi:hypothetical protein
VHRGRDRPQAQAVFVKLTYCFQFRAQDFPFPPQIVRLALATKPGDGRGGALTSANALLLGDRCQDGRNFFMRVTETEEPNGATLGIVRKELLPDSHPAKKSRHVQNRTVKSQKRTSHSERDPKKCLGGAV